MPLPGPRKRGPVAAPTPARSASDSCDLAALRKNVINMAIIRAAEDAERVTNRCLVPRGLAIGDVIRLFDLERSEARTRLRKLCTAGALIRHGQSHAARYFTKPPEYHGLEGTKLALLQYAKMCEGRGFTRVEFLREFPFPKSSIYSAVTMLVRQRKMATRGRTNSLRYYLREFAPPRSSSRKV